MTYNGREVMAQVAVEHDVHIMEDVFASRDDGIEFVAYIGRGEILALIGWDKNNCGAHTDDETPFAGADLVFMTSRRVYAV